ncbi:MAG: QueT transporter family protein [Lachnospiraceae bacterium]|nr:QueT transporter family protein [Lachnospiraceae bacterium]
MRNKSVLYLTQAAMIAALYVVLTYLANALGLASQAIQVRFSEALTILPAFTGAAVPGLFIGCILANILTNCAPWDVVFGSIATLLGALGTYFIAHPTKAKRAAEEITAIGKRRWLLPLPPIVANTLIVPFVLAYVYRMEGTIPYFMLTVGIGEVISCYVLGLILFFGLYPIRHRLFGTQK